MRSYQRPCYRSTRENGVKRLLAGVFALLSLSLAIAFATSQERLGVPRDDHRFTSLGSESCRACHRPIFAAWQTSPHALSTSRLTATESFDPSCGACHVPDAEALETGVGCEACHGPGSAYAELDVMIDPLKRRAAGLQRAADTCVSCHNPGHAFHVERDLEAAARTVH